MINAFCVVLAGHACINYAAVAFYNARYWHYNPSLLFNK